MEYTMIIASGASAGMAVFFGFKAAKMMKCEEDEYAYYVKLSALLTGLSVVLLGILCLIS